MLQRQGSLMPALGDSCVGVLVLGRQISQQQHALWLPTTVQGRIIFFLASTSLFSHLVEKPSALP